MKAYIYLVCSKDGSLKIHDRIGGVMVSMLDSSVVYRGFEYRSGQTKDYKIGICCFSAKHAVLTWFPRILENGKYPGISLYTFPVGKCP